MNKMFKAKWARKLMQSKYFVVLTDKESVIALEGTSPDSMNDAIALAAQSSALVEFRDKIQELINAHNSAISKLHGSNTKRRSTVGKTKTKATRSRKAKKITVREG